MDTNTIAGLNPATATKQEVFDFVAKQLIQQGKPAYENDACRYRSENGSKCAAGHLIPDGEYLQALEGKSVCSLARRVCLPPTLSLFINAVGMAFLQDLQTAHDFGAFREPAEWLKSFVSAMHNIALKHGLNSAVLDGVS